MAKKNEGTGKQPWCLWTPPYVEPGFLKETFLTRSKARVAARKLNRKQSRELVAIRYTVTRGASDAFLDLRRFDSARTKRKATREAI